MKTGMKTAASIAWARRPENPFEIHLHCYIEIIVFARRSIMLKSNLAELQARWTALDDLATRLGRDERKLSTALEPDDELVRDAREFGTPIVDPLTIGTLLASVLGEIESVEMAIDRLRRNEHPGEDVPDPLADWEPRAARFALATRRADM